VRWGKGSTVDAPWNDVQTISEEVFGVDRFRTHGHSLALAQHLSQSPRRILTLKVRLGQNLRLLQDAHRRIESWLASGHTLTPAAEWLVNNSHVVEELVSQITLSLPDRYYNELPKLADGPLAGYPRVFSIAWAYVAHTDSRTDPEDLRQFVEAYQEITPLSIGELWALPISINLVLVENLRRARNSIPQRAPAG
jgi:cyclic beta-1,2-glucan synthetase